MLRRHIAIWVLLAGAAVARAGQTATFDELSKSAEAALQSNPQKAISLYRQALELKPGWAEGWFYLAASEYQTREYAECRKDFDRAAELAPENGTVFAFRGLCEAELRDPGKALSDINKGEALGVGDNQQFISTIRNRAAGIEIRAGNFAAAIDQLLPLAAMGDDSKITIEDFGASALGISRTPDEIEGTRLPLIELAGRAAWIYSSQRSEEAGPFFKQLATKYPNEAGVHYLNGIYLMARDQDAALAEFRRELQINRLNVMAHLQIAALELKNGHANAATVAAKEAARLQPANPLCHVALGRAYLGETQTVKAVAELEEAVKLGPGLAQARFHLERAYRKAGRNTDAEREKEAFLRLKRAQNPLTAPGGDGPSEQVR